MKITRRKHLIKSRMGPRVSLDGRFEKEKYRLPLPGIVQFIGRAAYPLYRLKHRGC